MNINTLPGTTIELPRSMPALRTLSSSLFLTGGLTPMQVADLTNLSAQVLRNWVKRGFLSPPVNKRYSQPQFFHIAILNFLKDHLQLEVAARVIKHVNINLPGRGGDLIDETSLYHYFIEALFLTDNDIGKVDAAVKHTLQSFREPYHGARGRLTLVIRILIILHISSQIKNSAELLIRNAGLKGN